MKVTWISHRGYKKQAVENTREAFSAATAHGFVALETDLRLTKDRHIVLHHDVSLARLAGIDTSVADMTRAELSEIDLRENGAMGRLMFLDQFLREFPGCSWTFDIKPESAIETIRTLYEWSVSQGMFDLVLAQSKFVLWHETHEELLLSLFPKATCYARESECWKAGLWALVGIPQFSGLKADRVYALPPRLGPIRLYRKGLIERFHRRGARVLAFLPETEGDVRAAFASGADEILTNGLPLLD